MGNLFTPRMAINSHERHYMILSDEDMKKIGRGGPWTATITNTHNGRRYKVRGAACNAPRCYCDAIVVAALNGDSDETA